MADKQISDFPGSLPLDTDIFHTKKTTGEDNRTTGLAIKQYVLAAIPEEQDYHDFPTKSIATNDILLFENAAQDGYSKNTFLALKNFIGNLLMPVGFIIQNRQTSANPSTYLGFGTWAPIQGRVVIGEGTGTDVNSLQSTFTIGSTGGEYRTTLSVSQMPAHDHVMFATTVNNGGAVEITSSTQHVARTDNNFSSTSSYRLAPTTLEPLYGASGSRGNTNSHNNVQPFIVAYMWERVA